MGKTVRFNLKNVHYALLTETEQSGSVVYSWGTPKHVPGAVSLDLSQEGEVTPFYADGITYYRSIANNGYSGSLEMAKFPDDMIQDVWGDTLGSTSKVLTESANVQPKPFALLYQIDLDEMGGTPSDEYYVIYNVTGTRPNIGSSTIEDAKEPQTQTSDIAAIPLGNGKVLARTTASTPTATKTGWFSSVFVEA